MKKSASGYPEISGWPLFICSKIFYSFSLRTSPPANKPIARPTINPIFTFLIANPIATPITINKKIEILLRGCMNMVELFTSF